MVRYSNGEFKISVRQLVEFIFKSGDLDNRRSARRELAMLEGTKIHKKLQSQMGSGYTPEVPMKLSVPVCIGGEGEPDYVIALEGRADGIFGIPDEEAVGIDEIKGMYADVERFTEPIYVHQAQAMCYGYIQSLASKCDVYIQMTYVNLDTEQVKRFKEKFSHVQLAEWFDALINEYKKWCTFCYQHHISFLAAAQKCEFPYPYRPGQRELVVSAYRTLQRGKTLFIQASTGIGKTLSTVFPAVRVMGEEKAERIFYLTAKTITRSVAKEAIELLQRQGLAASYLLITAKEKMCFLPEMDCNPEVCPYAKGHMDRVNAAVYELITTKNGIDRENIREMAEKHQVCPFELSLDAAYYVDVIICDYNYVFDPHVRLQRFFGEGDQTGSLFLIDEAHNLIDRAREMISVTLVKEDFVKARKLIREVSRQMANRIDKCNKALLALKRECDEFHIYNDVSEIDTLVTEMGRLYDEFARFTERYPGFYNKEFSALFFTVRDFCMCLEYLNEGYAIYSRIDEEGQYILKLFCTDPSSHLKRCMMMGRGSVLFSATMLPISYYKRLLGGEPEDYAIYAQSPFDVKKRLLLLGGDVSTKYTRRTDMEYHKIGDYIRRVTAAHTGNYLVFFPSYAYLERMADELWDMEDSLAVQNSHMNEAQREEFLAGFRENANGEKTRIGMCVMGGIFSEGIDLKGDSLIGVIVVGTGLPQISKERDLLKNYFDEHEMDGFSYAYQYPGMNKVLQSAGRLIRTDEDRGIILLLDERFMRRDYRTLFPREWADIRLTQLDSVEKDVKDFWGEAQMTK